ncbi:hypothetical protein Prudu_381S000100 [Prunus dulcis]|uniref:Uncharacterized protein n=1 Tax=Prunus dulcis TaxID=3755 RepID=A0A5H2XJE2_PRUDU|nr:hypothetical protein Prudu_381S000100 [Prunus dulcis]
MNGRVYSNVFSGDSNIVLNILRIMKISDLAFWQMASPFGKWKSAVHYKFCSSSAILSSAEKKRVSVNKCLCIIGTSQPIQHETSLQSMVFQLAAHPPFPASDKGWGKEVGQVQSKDKWCIGAPGALYKACMHFPE